MKAFIITRA